MSTASRSSGYGVAKSGEPAFGVRGIVEGFYGTPWTHEERLDMIRFIGARGMNRFVYAPKDDPAVRRAWREPYSGAELERLAELVAVAAGAGVEVEYCLSPGLSIRYSDPADTDALLAKLDSVANLGVRRFGLLLDDIPPVLQHEADIAAFPDLASAHASLANAVGARLTTVGHSLAVCPTQYYGRGTEPYIRALGAALDGGIDLYWTGRLICSPSLDLDDAIIFAENTGRPPLYWDNYPVNDVAMTHELHIGPYRERDAQLATASRGVIANPMEFAEASKIAIATIADYLWSPVDYDPEESWRVALADVVGAADLDAYSLFAENSRTSCLSLDDAERLTRALERFDFLVETGRPDAAAEVLRDVARQYSAASAHLLSDRVENVRLIEQSRPWLESFAVGAEALTAMAELATSGRLDEDAPAVLAPYRDRLIAARRRVFGDALDMTLAQLVDPVEHRTTRSDQSHKEAAP